MEASFMPKRGERTDTGPLDWLNIKAEAVRPDGSWDIGSESVCTVELSGPDGKAARFFVVAGIDHNGKPWASITARKSNSETVKTVHGQWLDFKARAAAKIGGAQ